MHEPHESAQELSEIPPVTLDSPFADECSGADEHEIGHFEIWHFPKRTWAIARRRRIKRA